MRTSAPKVILIFILWTLSISCDEEKPLPGLEAVSSNSSLQVFEVFAVNVKSVRLNETSYVALFGEKEITLGRVSDTTLIGVVPEVAKGTHDLKATIEQHSLTLTYSVEELPVVSNPNEYLDNFIETFDMKMFETSLDDLVTLGVKTKDEAAQDLKAVKDSQAEALAKLATATSEEKKAVASFLAVNRGLFDDINVLLEFIQKSRASGNGRSMFVEARIKAQLLDLSIALGKIGAMIGGPALIFAGIGNAFPAGTVTTHLWASTGAALGAIIFRNQIIAQKNIVVAISMEMLNDAFIPVATSLKASFKRTQGEEVFANNIPKNVDVSLRLRNIQSSDLTSPVTFLKDFVSAYTALRNGWATIMSEFEPLPPLQTLKEQETTADLSKITLQVIDNPKVAGVVVREGERYRFKFSTTAEAHQKFRFKIVFTMEDIEPLVQEVEAVVQVFTYKAEIVKGNNQVGWSYESLSDSLTIRVTDQYGTPIAGLAVEWGPLTGGPWDKGSIAGGGPTNSKGYSMIKWTLGYSVPLQTMEATVRDNSGNVIDGGTLKFDAESKEEFTLKYVSGNGQMAKWSDRIPDYPADDLVVQVLDHTGRPARHFYDLRWDMGPGSGGLKFETSNADENGLIRFRWGNTGSLGVNTATFYVYNLHLNSPPTYCNGSPLVFTMTYYRP